MALYDRFTGFDNVDSSRSVAEALAEAQAAPVYTPPPPAPEPSSRMRRAVADPALGLLKGAISIPEAAVGLADIVTGGYAGKAAESLGFRPKEAKEIINTWQSPELQQARQNVAETKGFFPTIGAMVQNPSTIVDAAAESAPSMIGGAGVARGVMRFAPKLAPFIAAGIGEGAVSAGQSAEQIRQESADGLLNAKQRIAPLISGALTAGLGVLGGKIANRLGIADIDTMLAAGKIKQAEHGLLRRVAEGAFSEGILEELPQSAQEQASQNIATGKPWNEGVAEAAASGMLVGGIMSGGGNMLSGGRAKETEREPRLGIQTAPGPLSGAMRKIGHDPTASGPTIEAGWNDAGNRQAFTNPTEGPEFGRGPLGAAIEGEVIQPGRDVHQQLSGLLSGPVVDGEIVEPRQIGYDGPVRYGDGFITAPSTGTMPVLGLPAPANTVTPNGTAITPDQMREVLSPGLAEQGGMSGQEITSARKALNQRIPMGIDNSGITVTRGEYPAITPVAQDGPVVSPASSPAPTAETGVPPAGATSAAERTDIPGHIARAVSSPLSISRERGYQMQKETKDTLKEKMNTGEISPSSPIRMTTVDELKSIVDTGELSEGTDFEGRTGISAQKIDGQKPVVGYGSKTKVSAAIVFPSGSEVGKGEQPNEVKVDPRTNTKDLRFVIDGHKKLVTFDQLKAATSAQGQSEAAEKKPPPTDHAALIDRIAHPVNKGKFDRTADREAINALVAQKLITPPLQGRVKLTEAGRAEIDRRALTMLQQNGGKISAVNKMYSAKYAKSLRDRGLVTDKGKVTEAGRGVVGVVKEKSLVAPTPKPPTAVSTETIKPLKEVYQDRDTELAAIKNDFTAKEKEMQKEKSALLFHKKSGYKAKSELLDSAWREFKKQKSEQDSAVFDKYRPTVDAHPEFIQQRAEGAVKAKEYRAKMDEQNKESQKSQDLHFIEKANKEFGGLEQFIKDEQKYIRQHRDKNKIDSAQRRIESAQDLINRYPNHADIGAESTNHTVDTNEKVAPEKPAPEKPAPEKPAPEQAPPAEQPAPETTPKTTPAAVVNEAVKVAKKEGTPLKEQKKFLLENIDEAIKDAPEEASAELMEVLNNYNDRAKVQKAAEIGETVTIHVPDDGTFRVINTKAHLEQFKKNVEKMFPTTKYKKTTSTPAELRGAIPSVKTEAETAIKLYGSAGKAVTKMQAAVKSGAHEFENRAAEKQFNEVIKWLETVAKKNGETITALDTAASSDTVKGPFREGTTDEEKRQAEKLANTIPSPSLSRRRTASVLANAISTAFRTKGVFNFIGQTIETAEDLAAIAQVYRNPSFETLRYFFVKDGVIVAHTGVTSRLPGLSLALPSSQTDIENWLKKEMDACGADGFWMSHNHPSGDPTVSGADVRITGKLRSIFGEAFKGHIIINHNRYGVISGSGGNTVVEKIFSNDENGIHKPSVPHPLLGRKITSAPELVRLAYELQIKDGHFLMVGQRGKVGVSGLIEIPVNTPKGQIARILRRFANQSGSQSLFAVLPENSARGVNPKKLLELKAWAREARENGFLVDAITEDGFSSLADNTTLHIKDNGKKFGKEIKGYSVAETEEEYNARQGEATTRFSQAFPDVPIETLESPSDAPFPAPDDAAGAYFGGKVYLFRQNIKDTADAARQILSHEFTHHGIERLGGKGRSLLNQIATAYPAEIKSIMQQRGWEANAKNRRAAANELLAQYGETRLKPTLWQKVKNLVRDVLVRITGRMVDNSTLEAAMKEIRAAQGPGRTRVGAPMFAAAWHGSPHDHNGFSMDKVGTGEGAQAYGYGLYFAGNKEVAEFYRNNLSKYTAEDADAAIAYLKNKGISADPEEDWGYRNKADYVVLAATHGFEPTGGKGRLYSVELAPSEDEYLLWDKPLSEQSEKVKAALEDIAGFAKSFHGRDLNSYGGASIYNMLTKAIEDGFFDNGLKRRGITTSDPKQAASAYLHSLGIRGIKYLDGSSRSAGDGNYNYVIFDDKDVSITAKFSRRSDIQQHPTVQGIIASLFDRGRHVGPWMSTVGTMYHTAEKLAAKGMPGFKNVFNKGQDFLNDISTLAIKAESLAPHIFPKLDVVQGLNPFNKDAPTKADLRAISKPLYEGTLTGGASPMKGTVWTDAELKQQFNLTDKQIGMYREALKATNQSLDDHAKSLIAKIAKTAKVGFDRDADLQIMSKGIIDQLTALATERQTELDAKEEEQDAAFAALDENHAGNDRERRREQAKLHKQFTKETASLQAEIDKLTSMAENVKDISGKTAGLKKAGYFPLARFGDYVVKVTDADGNTLYRGHYDGVFQAKKAELALKEQFPDATVTRSTPSKEDYKLYGGMSLEAVQLFAEHMDREDVAPYQEYLKTAINNRSTMKRLIQRKGTAGYDTDAVRTLANFIVSNARYASSNYNMGDMLKLAEQMPSDDVKDHAIRLYKYLSEPMEEASKLRGYLFFHYLGGSLASGITNMTQPVLMTAPYLAQHAPGAKVTSQLISAAKQAWTNPEKIGGALGTALLKAEASGITQPQEIHQLTAMASNRMFASDNRINSALRAWGGFFATAEVFNRRTTFIASFNISKSNGMTDEQAYSEAEKAVVETQGIYSKANRPQWGRGTIGSTLFTFKQFSVMYLELFNRLPVKQKALMMGILFLASGAEGLPFAGDAEDIADTIGQWLGYSTNTRAWLNRNAREHLGDTAGKFATRGMSAVLPIDVHGRLGMENLIPGTGILKQSSDDKGQDIKEFFGPAGGLMANLGDALEMYAKGKIGRGTAALLPRAAAGWAQGTEMALTGTAHDKSGKRTYDADTGDAVTKFVGFNPSKAADESLIKQSVLQDRKLMQVRKDEILEQWATGIAHRDKDEIVEARQKLIEWNRDNPELYIRVKAQQIAQRVKAMRMSGKDRFLKGLPKAMRRDVAEDMG